MACSPCNYIKSDGKRCKLYASCRLGCGLYCWIHSEAHVIGSLCEDYEERSEPDEDEGRRLERLKLRIQQMYEFAVEWEDRLQQQEKIVRYRKSI